MVDDLHAFRMGIRADLMSGGLCDEGIYAITTSPVMPKQRIICECPAWISKYFPKGTTFSIVAFTSKHNDGKVIVTGKQGGLLPLKHLGQAAGHTAVELFAGIGGWSYGAQRCGLETHIMVESDYNVAVACAKTHGLQVFTCEQIFNELEHDTMPSKCILCADATSIQTLFLIGLYQTNTWLASPPCQPWSRAGTLQGLNSLDGIQFPRLLTSASLMKAKAVIAENVPGFSEHPHHKQILAITNSIGWDCAISTQDKVIPLLPIIRNRWLGLFIPKHVNINRASIRKATEVVIPNQLPGIGKETSIGAIGCIQHELHQWEKDQAIPDEDVIKIMSIYNLLPSNVKERVHPNATAEEVLALRVKNPRQVFPNVMALQGVQHELPMHHLRSKGLHSFLIEIQGVKRFALPYELSAGMGYPDTLILPKKFRESWHIIGNGLTSAHAALMCYRTHLAMGEQSPFKCKWKSIYDLCNDIKASLIDLNDYIVESDQTWMWLRPAVFAKNQDGEGGESDLPDAPPPYEPDDVEQPPTKSRCISLTWEFVEECPASPIPKPDLSLFPNIAKQIVGTVDLKEASLLTKQQHPVNEKLMKALQNGLFEHEHGNDVATILHDQGIWAKSAWKHDRDTIGMIIQKVLPHAKPEAFENICIGGEEITFNTIPVGVKDCDIIFTPNFFVRVVVTQLLEYDLPIRVDVTIDPCVFSAQGEKVQPLDLQSFGPDAKGVVIVQMNDAKPFIPPTKMSADPLAMIVLTSKAIGDLQPVPIPATNVNGAPMVTLAVILNFGDIQVECKPVLPTATLPTLETSIVEFRIEKQ
eukprot:Skav224188  [mRNA]  locus=scaffold1975:364463:367817:+ [translate_table: standard]